MTYTFVKSNILKVMYLIDLFKIYRKLRSQTIILPNSAQTTDSGIKKILFLKSNTFEIRILCKKINI